MKRILLLFGLLVLVHKVNAQEPIVVVEDAPLSCYYFLPFIDSGDQNNYDCIYNIIYDIDKEYTLLKYNVMEVITASPFVKLDSMTFYYKIDYYITHTIKDNDTIPCDTMIVSDYCISNTDFNSRLYGTNPQYKKDRHITRCYPMSQYREHESNMFMLLLHESIIDIRMASDPDKINKIANRYTKFIEDYFGVYINTIPRPKGKKIIPYKKLPKVEKWTETENLMFKDFYNKP